MRQRWAGGELEHEEVVGWVKAHDEVLSANLETIIRYPMPFRKVIVRLMPHENRVAVWREHLEVVAASDTTLNAAQQAFVLEKIAALDAIFSSASAKSEWSARIAPLFTAEQNYRIFQTLGPPEPPGGLPLPPDAVAAMGG